MPEMLVLELTLLTVQPRTWRRIIVGADYTFEHLHRIVQVCFGWQGLYSHQFHCPRPDSTDYVTIAPLLGIDHGDDAIEEQRFFCLECLWITLKRYECLLWLNNNKKIYSLKIGYQIVNVILFSFSYLPVQLGIILGHKNNLCPEIHRLLWGCCSSVHRWKVTQYFRGTSRANYRRTSAASHPRRWPFSPRKCSAKFQLGISIPFFLTQSFFQ